MKKTILSICLLSITALGNTYAQQTISPDSTKQALEKLKQVKMGLVNILPASKDKAHVLERMLELGLWDNVLTEIKKQKALTDDYKLLYADYYILNNDFKSAEKYVNQVYNTNKKKEKAVLLKAFLEMQAWKLPQAAQICENALKTNPSNKLKLMLGRVKLLQKDYKKALSLAKEVEAADRKNAAALMLEADVYFWDQKPQLAEAPLLKSIAIDPFNADARFSYGYAIWRRFDATLLNAMAAQWEVALAVNPLHFQTHWHWGNGHTNLTYADYAQPEDEQVRKELKPADELFQQNKLNEALDYTRKIQAKYPNSVLPLMHRGSLYHVAYDMDRKAGLDSAEHIFREILKRKRHYGPAHNGLSAVIKAKRIPYLSVYDSITNHLHQTKIKDMENFKRVFPDVSYYSGDMVKAMAWNQLYTSVVYFPFLTKGDNVFRIPPLHKDLAETMNSPYFRTSTTFDNRQWMDIRGVGSGAAAIEYVERGAYLERNVILHEYVHLFHGRVLTDAENRAIRAHYYKAMKEGRTLDYYSQNNESEYFAQTYPAYFEPVKVHPLDFKSMNTTNDLITKDPEMYQFIDALVKKERAYLSGKKEAMASNWAQVYLNLSQRSRMQDRDMAKKYLDTALTYDAKYLPAMLAYSGISISEKKLDDAEAWLKKAEQIDPNYAPIYAAYANLTKAKYDNNLIAKSEAIQKQADYLQKSYKMETDYSELARVNGQLREMYRSNGLYPEAIDAGLEYAKNGAAVSTYLRDRIDDANAFSASLKAELGYAEPVQVLRDLVTKKPQNYEYRNLLADALATQGKYDEAIKTINEAQRILAASNNSRTDYNMRLAEFYLAQGNKSKASEYINMVLSAKSPLRGADQLRMARLLAKSGDLQTAKQVFSKEKEGADMPSKADYAFTKAILSKADGSQGEYIQNLSQALQYNPYLFAAYKALRGAYTDTQATDQLKALDQNINNLKIKPGVAYQL